MTCSFSHQHVRRHVHQVLLDVARARLGERSVPALHARHHLHHLGHGLPVLLGVALVLEAGSVFLLELLVFHHRLHLCGCGNLGAVLDLCLTDGLSDRLWELSHIRVLHILFHVSLIVHPSNRVKHTQLSLHLFHGRSSHLIQRGAGRFAALEVRRLGRLLVLLGRFLVLLGRFLVLLGRFLVLLGLLFGVLFPLRRLVKGKGPARTKKLHIMCH